MNWKIKALIASCILTIILVVAAGIQNNRIESLSKNINHKSAWSKKTSEAITQVFLFGNGIIWYLFWSRNKKNKNAKD